MTKRLIELFDLPTDEADDTESANVTTSYVAEVTAETMHLLDKIDDALPLIRGLEASDSEMDEIAAMAINSYKDLMDLGMNVEARVAAEILGSASQFLGHAITAKNAKINKKLKMIDLQLKKAKLDIEKSKASGDDDPRESKGRLLDRNELLAEVLAQVKEDSNAAH